MVTAGVSVVTAAGVSVVAAVVGLDVPEAAPVPPVLAIVPCIGARTITARAKQTLLCPLLPILLMFPLLPVRPLEFMWRKVVPGKHCAKTVTRAPDPRPFTLAAAVVVLPDVVPDEVPEPLLEPVPEPVVVAVATGVSVAAIVAVAIGVSVTAIVGAAVALVVELLDELLDELPVVLFDVPLPPVLLMKPVAPQPHIRVLERRMYVCGPLPVSIVRVLPAE